MLAQINFRMITVPHDGIRACRAGMSLIEPIAQGHPSIPPNHPVRTVPPPARRRQFPRCRPSGRRKISGPGQKPSATTLPNASSVGKWTIPEMAFEVRDQFRQFCIVNRKWRQSLLVQSLTPGDIGQARKPGDRCKVGSVQWYVAAGIKI